jgi:GNAT superfamily N-acetyltransferase
MNEHAVGTAVETSVATVTDLSIRPMDRADLPRLQELSPPSVKPVEEFAMYSTLVAELAGRLVGYTQFYLSVDKILHSRAIRIEEGHKGQGIGRALMEGKEALARSLGAIAHYYPVDRDGEVALKKMLTSMGFHLCLKHQHVWVYVKDLGEN